MIKITYELEIDGKKVKISEDEARKLHSDLNKHFGSKVNPLDDLLKRTNPSPLAPMPMYDNFRPTLIGDPGKWPEGTIICEGSSMNDLHRAAQRLNNLEITKMAERAALLQPFEFNKIPSVVDVKTEAIQ